MAHGDNNGNSEGNGFLSKAIKILSLPIAAVSGYWVASRSIFNHTYANVKDHDILSDLTGKDTERHKKMTQIGKEAREAANSKTMYEITEKSVPLHADHYEKVLERFKYAGLGTTRKRWKFLRPDQKDAVLIEFMTVAGIAVGALLTLANNKTISHAFSSDDQSVSIS